MKSSRPRIEQSQIRTRGQDMPSVGSADVSVGCNTSLSPADSRLSRPFHMCDESGVSLFDARREYYVVGGDSTRSFF
jgi:hypothetical protein